MGDNDEQQPPREPHEPREVMPHPGSASPPQAQGQGSDPEQQRQFEEFQRFQAYLRYTRREDGSSQEVRAQLTEIQAQLGQVNASQQRTERELNPPLWRRILRSRLLHWLIVVIVVVVLASWGYQHFFGGSGGDDGAPKLPKAPDKPGGFQAGWPTAHQTVANVYVGIGNVHVSGTTAHDNTCALFTASGKHAFARDVGARSCEQAIGELATQVTDRAAYRNPHAQDAVIRKTPRSAVIDSCRVDVSGGPTLGTFTLTYQPNDTWLITDHTPGTC